MSVTSYEPRAEYIGDGTLDEYTFDFKIKALTDLVVGVVDTDLTLDFEVLGDDTTDLDSVDFDPVNGGGTVYLPAVLATGKQIYILLADDDPLQESEFRNKGDFELKRIEDALDAIVGQTQRLAYLVQRSLKLTNIFPDSDTFDVTVPIKTTDQVDQDTANRVVAVNEDGDGMQLGPSILDLAAQAAAADADAAAAAASAAQAAADAATADADATAAAASAAAAAASVASVQILSLAAAIGSTPTAAGMSIVPTGVLTPQPADSTRGGFLTAAAQVIGGVKTFFDRMLITQGTGITAFAGGGQASATALTKQINDVTTVATADDSVKMPVATAGEVVTVVNSAAKNLAIYPQTGENFKGRSANTLYRLGPDQGSVQFVCHITGQWAPLGKNIVVFGSNTTPVPIDPAVGFTVAAGAMDIYADEVMVIFTKNLTGTSTATTPISASTKVGSRLTLVNEDSNADNRSLRLSDTGTSIFNGVWDSFDTAQNNVIDMIMTGTDGSGAFWKERSRLI